MRIEIDRRLGQLGEWTNEFVEISTSGQRFRLPAASLLTRKVTATIVVVPRPGIAQRISPHLVFSPLAQVDSLFQSSGDPAALRALRQGVLDFSIVLLATRWGG
jgi:hypothetical protein